MGEAQLDQELEEAATGTEEEEVASEEQEGTDADDTESEELPFWQQEDDKGVPVAKHVALKHKLRGKLQERDEENERLRQELAQLKQGKPTTERPKRPRQADFDTDEEYEDALDTYEEARDTYLQTQTVQSSTETERQQRRRQQVAQAVDGHYDRASKLVEEASISPETYKQADTDVKALIDGIIPGGGENVFAGLVETVGEGSEKTMFYLGRNKTAQAEFANALREDPSGLKAAVYLGRVTERIKGAKGTGSRAPAPAAQLKGDGAVSAQASGLRKKWAEAHKKGSAQSAYNIKKEARAKGIDTSSWT